MRGIHWLRLVLFSADLDAAERISRNLLTFLLRSILMYISVADYFKHPFCNGRLFWSSYEKMSRNLFYGKTLQVLLKRFL